MKTFEEKLRIFVADHLLYINEVRAGKALDSDGKVIKHDDFFKGWNAAFVNVYNFIKNETTNKEPTKKEPSNDVLAENPEE